MNLHNIGPTVYGIEHEYSVTATLGDDELSHEIVGSCHSPDYKIGLVLLPKAGSLDNIDDEQYKNALEKLGIYKNDMGMLSNGARFYIDPSGPEYSTPETTTASEAVLRTLDGDKVMFAVLRNLQENNLIRSFQLNRRIVDHNGSSRGVHINTSTSHESEPSTHLIECLSALNVAKGALFGSGGLIVNKQHRTEFHHSPRLSLTNQVGTSHASFVDRPIVRQPFKNDVACRRIETITSDALNFAWPLRASMVLTNALVKLTEIDIYKNKIPLLYSPVSEARNVGLHGNNTLLEVDDGYDSKKIYPSQLLRKIAELALEANEKLGHLDSESLQVLEEIIETSDLIRIDASKVMQRVESIARYEFMQRKMEEHKVKWSSEKLCQFDYYWDKIGGGVAEKLREVKGWGWHGFDGPDTPFKARKRLTKPPTGTRAELRGKLIRDSKGLNSSNWYDFDLGSEKHEAFHPLSTCPPNS